MRWLPKAWLLKTVGSAHGQLVFQRRTTVLARHLSDLLPPACTSLLDVGCGDGTISLLVGRSRSGVQIDGVDVHPRETAVIPVTLFDGTTLPYASGAVDVVMLVDVLHHTDDPEAVLRECARVARHGVLIKDHTCEGPTARRILTFMDWVGNRSHGVRLPYNYWSRAQWEASFRRLGLLLESERTALALYPHGFRWLFEKGLHFVAYLRKGA